MTLPLYGWRVEQSAKRQLRPAVELAFHYARAVARTDSEAAVPSVMRPMLGFSKLPAGAFDAVIDAIDADDEFRLRFVETLDEQDVGSVGWAWLARPEGWEAVLGGAGVDAASALRLATAEAATSALRERVRQLEHERNAALTKAQRAESATQRSSAESEKNRAMALAADEDVRRLSAKVHELTERAIVAEKRATRAEASLGEERKQFKAEQRAMDLEPAPSVDSGHERPTPERRNAIRSVRGLSDDTPDGLRELLAIERVRVVVDGYNVAMLGWPAITLREQRTRLISALANFAATADVTFDVVFDGDDFVARDRTSTAAAVRVAWSPSGVTADDVIVEMANRIDASVAIVAITDDTELRDRLGALGCNIVGSRTLVSLVS